MFIEKRSHSLGVDGSEPGRARGGARSTTRRYPHLNDVTRSHSLGIDGSKLGRDPGRVRELCSIFRRGFGAIV